jgi:hypothetical protein
MTGALPQGQRFKETGNAPIAVQQSQSFLLSQQETGRFTARIAGKKANHNRENLLQKQKFKETGNVPIAEQKSQSFLLSQLLTGQFTAKTAGQKTSQQKASGKF